MTAGRGGAAGTAGLVSGLSAALGGYVFVGYPLLVALAARTRPAAVPGPAYLPPVTVVVSALDEEAALAAKLEGLADLDYPQDRLQVVVVTDGSTDGTEAIARASGLPGLQVLHRPGRQGKAAAMSRGLSVARHDVVVFTDANNLLAPDALRQVVAPLADPMVGAATGAKGFAGGVEELTGGERAYWRYESFVKRQESRLGCCTGVIGELLAVRRELVPPFPPGLVNDDFWLAMQVVRAGKRVAYAPGALSYEPTAGSLADDVVRRRRIAAGRWQSVFGWRTHLPVRRPVVLWQVVSHKHLRLLLPAAMTGAALGTVAEVLLGGGGRLRPRALLAGQVALYGSAAVAGTLPRSAGPARTAALGARYLVRTSWSSASGLLSYLRGRDRLHLWERAGRA